MKTLNLVVSFVLELIMLAAWAWLGISLPLAEPYPALASVLFPLLVIGFWGLFAAPRARYPLPIGPTIALKALFLGGGALALATVGQPLWGAVDGILVVLNLALAAFWGQMVPVDPQIRLRRRLTGLLEDYGRQYPEEAAVTGRFLDFVASGEILQGKENHHRHITASTWIVSPDRSKVLLTHHAKLGIWVQLGGHTDEGEDWVRAALREAREESGLRGLKLARSGLFDLDIHPIPARETVRAHEHYDLRFLVIADDRVPLTVSAESHELAWVPLADLGRFTAEESQHRMARKTVLS